MESTLKLVQEEDFETKKDRKTYMREYMNSYYKKNHIIEKKRGLARYYKKTNNISDEDKTKYGNDLALIVKTFNSLDKILEQCPEHLGAILAKYSGV
mgnify:FL=1